MTRSEIHRQALFLGLQDLQLVEQLIDTINNSIDTCDDWVYLRSSKILFTRYRDDLVKYRNELTGGERL